MKLKAYTNWRNIQLWNKGQSIQIRLTHQMDTDVEISIPVRKVKFLTNQVTGTYIKKRTLFSNIKDLFKHKEEK